MIKIDRILCPTDLTSESEKGIRYANALARAFDAELLLCHCASEIPDLATSESLKHKLINSLRAQAGAVQSPTTECTAIIIEGDPAGEIVRLATERDVDLIVMNSRRKTNLTALIGSTTEAVTRKAPCPVMVVHPDEREWVGKTMCEIDLHRILVAYDFSSYSELALKYGLALAQEFQTELHLLHILPVSNEPAIATLTKGIDTNVRDVARLLRETVPEEAYLWCQVSQAVGTGQPDEEILSYSIEHDIDLICMGVHGVGFVQRALFGSNTDRVMRRANCPVLVARPVQI